MRNARPRLRLGVVVVRHRLALPSRPRRTGLKGGKLGGRITRPPPPPEGSRGVHCPGTPKGLVPMNEWVIVGVIALIVFLFGAKKLPDLARSLGKSSSEFKKGMSEGEIGRASCRERV